ncbi:MAG: 3-hydroxyacyl-CoA dehydrogenase NAD-binding domain-containing protein [Polyangiaceae bacterium]
MTQPIRRVAVLGAGVMGSGIAAHLANAGVPVLLLDIVPPKLSADEAKKKSARNAFADGAVQKLLKHKPAPLSHPSRRLLIQTGNFDDDLAQVASCDLVIEAIIEKLDIKRSLFEKLEKIVDGTSCIVASNTSGLRIVDMLEGRTEAFKKHFLVTHFFNPPRYMKLLELVRSPHTDDAVLERLVTFGREVLGKGIVLAKDTPNFVANRIGTHSLMAVVHLMLEHDLAPEDIDAITGKPMGHPKSATFRTADVVGLDTLVHVVDNCHAVLTEDEDRAVFEVPAYIRTMLEKGQLGSKTKAGFYKKQGNDILTLDPKTGEYRARGGDGAIRKACKSIAGEESPEDRIKKLVAAEGKVGEVAWKAISRSLAYAARRVGEIADDVSAIDDAMRWGFNWELGPFQIWDALGFAETTKRMKDEGIALPASIDKMLAGGAKGFYADGKVYDLGKGEYQPQKSDEREASLATLRSRHGSAPVLKTYGGEAWDLGDGVLGVTFTSKANSLDEHNIGLLHDAAAKAEEDFRGMVLFNQGDNFCVGANLLLVAAAAGQGQFDQIESLVKRYQDATQRMKYASVPVVAAPFQMTLGGGLELCFGCDAVQASLETYSGLVEVGVGLIPGGAGTLNMLWRALEGIPEGVEVDTYAVVTQVFKNIAMAKVATSAHEAMELGFFRRTDGVSFDRARQLYEAKQRVIGLAEAGYHPPAPKAYKLPGESGIATLSMMVNTLVAGGFATEHDAFIANKLAVVLCGGVSGASHEVTEQEILDLEREAFVSLCGHEKSQARMQHFLMNNKPLRN